eukprot:Gb_02610 [translate_table: standard]
MVVVSLRPPSQTISQFYRNLSPQRPCVRRRRHHATFCSGSAKEEEDDKPTKVKTVFVAGATGNTGKRIVTQLLSRGFAVRAGVLDIERAKNTLPNDQSIQFVGLPRTVAKKVKADVTEGAVKLSEAIGDAEAVICATGFRPSLDFLAPWKVGSVAMSEHAEQEVPAIESSCPAVHSDEQIEYRKNELTPVCVQVDNFGTVNLVDACRRISVNRFILVSSILVNGAAMGQIFNPAYIVLNIFGLTLIAKLQAEQYIRKSGINFTIVRPGGLRNDPPSGSIVMEPEDTLFEGSISRDQVAEVAVEALLYPESSYKVVEIVSRADAPKRSLQQLFGSIKKA